MGTLKKRRPDLLGRKESARNSDKRASLRPSLSLPDLKLEPFLDPVQWDAMPLRDIIPALKVDSSDTSPIAGTRAWDARPSIDVRGEQRFQATTTRKEPTLIASPTGGFHRPFSPARIRTNLDAGHPSALFPLSAQVITSDYRNDRQVISGYTEFGSRKEVESWSSSPWRSTGYEEPHSAVATQFVHTPRRTGTKIRGAGKLNVMVAGGKGVGKTSFIRLLQNALKQPTEPLPAPKTPSRHRVPSPGSVDRVNEPSTPSSSTSSGPPIGTPRSLDGSFASMHVTSQKSAVAPTTSMQAEIIQVNAPYERMALRIIDTPGLEIGGDAKEPPAEAVERERGVAGIVRVVEERFECLLREEQRVARRRHMEDENLVHLVLYLLDARTVLRPSMDDFNNRHNIDWSGVGLFDETGDRDIEPVASESRKSPSPGISQNELDIIHRLHEKVNVMLVITQSDAFSRHELEEVKAAVKRDAQGALGWDGNHLLASEEAEVEEDGDNSEDEDNSGADQPSSPLAVFCPPEALDGSNHIRQYPWGSANPMDESHSDLQHLLKIVLRDRVKHLRTTTRHDLYESYRTERLQADRKLF